MNARRPPDFSDIPELEADLARLQRWIILVVLLAMGLGIVLGLALQ